MSTQRLLAVILSIGGVGWGLFCLPFLFWNPSYALTILGPGYFVTFGYILRACSSMSSGARIVMWFLSALVQGAWLIWALKGVAQVAWFGGTAFEGFTLAWWTFACLASVWAAFTDREVAPIENSVPPHT